uniref:Putative gag protein n=1 Tax=Philodina roseola TaxID=96448 RepID=A1YGR8_PHIRO|nr:putative gag protein [Philodina roseola]
MSYSESEQSPKDLELIEEESQKDFINENQNTDDPQKDSKRRQSIIPPSHQPPRATTALLSEGEPNQDDQNDELNFDSFILSHFTPFSGTENVIEWLDNTDKKFNDHKIPRNLRYIAIPLLVEGEAKRKYIRTRNKIRSFDDFYEFLLIHYDTSAPIIRNIPYNSSSHLSHHNNGVHDSILHKNVTFDDQLKQRVSNLDLSDNLPPRPILRSTALADFGATKIFGDDSAQQSATTSPSSFSHVTSSLNQTTYVIHKAIIDNLIKNPKIFQGGKEDVKQWLEDIEQLFDTAQIPDSHKLDLIFYSLRGEARRWYKNTKSSLTSWSIFVKEVKEAFLSPFHDELAFKKLESYTQGVNQPVRSFYNEVLKLCNETDPDMSEAMKLRHLLKKAKPTLQYEIRKKKPTTTKQFLEYAKEQEELLQLSNIDIDSDFDLHDHKRSNQYNQLTSTVTSARSKPSNSNMYTDMSPMYNQTGRSDSSSSSFNDYKYNSRFNQPVNSFNSSFQKKPSYIPNRPWNTYQQFPSNTYRTNNSFRQFPSNNQTYSSNRRANNIQDNNRNTNQTPQVNNITATTAVSSPQPTPLLSNSDICTQCLETGHQACVCPRF